ncbi:glycoside hydrolase family 47 protein [Laccaria amethystina LaAM-08-1]|uniref:Glycoside hydrolase family 47 protein n=1 Tax=Laccaria amethystina LaAM-08-1 TaxID=1095629 RepID=A0A0C9XG96_9AGAR|nr:glycoside hydrolase family 47 protein [Laccaria amethystina LaAM-08-1]
MLPLMISCWLFRGNFSDKFNGWGVTLLDSLDTMYIMGLHDDFEDALGLWGILLSLCRPVRRF